MLDAKQIRAARALLNWSREELAEQTGISVPALARAETGESQLRATSAEKIKSSLENAGIIFTDGHGVKMRTEIVRIFEGLEGIERFYNEIYNAAQTMTREFLQFGLRYRDIADFHSKEAVADYLKKMTALNKIIFRCISSEEERSMKKTDYTTYRYLSDDRFAGVPFYVFGDNLAIISLRSEGSQAIVISDAKVAEEYRHQFEVMWSVANA